MFHSIFSHWKTTLAGIAAGVSQVILNGRSGKSLAAAIAMVVIGAVAKDGDK